MSWHVSFNHPSSLSKICVHARVCVWGVRQIQIQMQVQIQQVVIGQSISISPARRLLVTLTHLHICKKLFQKSSQAFWFVYSPMHTCRCHWYSWLLLVWIIPHWTSLWGTIDNLKCKQNMTQNCSTLYHRYWPSVYTYKYSNLYKKEDKICFVL